MPTYLVETPFDDPRGCSNYSVTVDYRGVTIYSECCGELMSEDTARKTRDAITAWLNRRAD